MARAALIALACGAGLFVMLASQGADIATSVVLALFPAALVFALEAPNRKRRNK